MVPDFFLGSPATSSSSVLERKGEFLSTGDSTYININWQKYASHLYMSDVANQLVKAQTGAITQVKARYIVDMEYTNKSRASFPASKFGNRFLPQIRNKK